MRASIPATEADRPPLLSAGVVALVALVVGLGVARWTVRPAPPSAEAPTEVEGPEEPGPEEPGAPTDRAPEPATPEESPAEAETAPETPVTEAEAAPEVETPTIVPAVEPEPPSAPAASGTPAAPSAALPPRGPARGTLVRGRVAYLRCEGGGSGAGCARDRALEDAIWSAIETLPTCAAGPTPPGQADVVIELSDEGVEVRARDTFAADVVRLDGAATVACLSALAADPVLTASSRRVFLSFRFRIE